jgi:lysophospholipase L1-like esterase
MSDKKISELPVATVSNDTDIFVINQGGVSKTVKKSLITNSLGDFKSDGSVPMTGGIQGNSGSGNFIAVSPVFRYLADKVGNIIARFLDISEGFGFTTSGFFMFQKTTALTTTNRTAQWQDKDYIGVADLSDIPTVSGVYAPIAGGFSFTGNVNGVTPTELGYISGLTSAIQPQLNGKQGTISLTTTGTSGASTLIGSVLNIPQYSGGGIDPLSLREVGNVILNLFASAGDLSSFTATGSASFTFNSPGLLISGGASNYSNFFTNNYVTVLNRYEYSIEFNSTVNGTGLAIGFPSSLGVRIDTSAGANRGKLYIENFTGGVGSTLATSATALTYSNTTDTIRLSFRRDRNTIYAKIENVTTPSNAPVYLIYKQNMAAGQPNLQGVGNPTIYAYGGTQIVTKYKYDNKELQKSKLLIIGDSNAEGWGQGATTWAGVLASNYNGHIALQTRAGATSVNLSNAIAETILINPQYALVNIGTNDAISGKTLATFQTDFALLIKQLTDNGITPIICTIIPHSTGATNTLITTYNSWITSTYGGIYTVIDTFTAQSLGGLYNPLYNSGVHMTPAGGLNFANTVISALDNFTLPVANIWANTVKHGTTVLRNSTGGKTIDFTGTETQSQIDFYCTFNSNGRVLNLNYASNAVNYFSLYARGSGSAPQIQVLGTDTNIGFDFLPKGTGAYYWRCNVVAGALSAHHTFASQSAVSGEQLFFSCFNGGAASVNNKSTFAFVSVNASSSATVRTYVGGKAEVITAGAEASSFFVDNVVGGARTNVLNIIQRNFSLNNSTGSFGGGVGVVFINNAVTAPTTNPTGGGILSSEAGDPTWFPSSGAKFKLTPSFTFSFQKAGALSYSILPADGGSVAYTNPMGYVIPKDMTLADLSVVLGTSSASGAGTINFIVKKLSVGLGNTGSGVAISLGAGTTVATLAIASGGALGVAYYRNAVSLALNVSLAAGDIIWVETDNFTAWTITDVKCELRCN